jgi:hypothetical protein
LTDGWSPSADVLNHTNKPRREEVYTRRGTTSTILGLGQLLKVPELAEAVEAGISSTFHKGRGVARALFLPYRGYKGRDSENSRKNSCSPAI